LDAYSGCPLFGDLFAHFLLCPPLLPSELSCSAQADPGIPVAPCLEPSFLFLPSSPPGAFPAPYFTRPPPPQPGLPPQMRPLNGPLSVQCSAVALDQPANLADSYPFSPSLGSGRPPIVNYRPRSFNYQFQPYTPVRSRNPKCSTPSKSTSNPRVRTVGDLFWCAIPIPKSEAPVQTLQLSVIPLNSGRLGAVSIASFLASKIPRLDAVLHPAFFPAIDNVAPRLCLRRYLESGLTTSKTSTRSR